MTAPGLPAAPPERRFALAAWHFQRWLAVVLGIAFTSLAVQVRGLFGEGGIVPLQEQLAWLAKNGVGFFDAPSIFWLVGGSGTTLVAAAWAGVALAAMLFAGVWPRATVLLAWALYLSFASVGEPFLGFQWDALLLEVCLVAPFVLPAGFLVAPRRAPEPGRIGLFLERFVLFRLMLLSGAVKLTSGDPVWRDLTALGYHFWTQPLPGPLSFWAAHLPAPLQAIACALTLSIELSFPLGIFLGRPWRLVSAAGFVLLQVVIGLTGNYGFFNLLTVTLVLLLLDDAFLGRLFPDAPRAEEPRPPGRLRPAALAVAGFVVLVGSIRFAGRLELPVPAPLRALARATSPLSSINAYGLFADMTTERPEIELEGSDDGRTWQTYRFRYKPRLDAAPRLAGFHMPRLDWQMWFAALGSCRSQTWLHLLLRQLLSGSADVRDLFDDPPFPSAPPRLLRTTLYRYTFTTEAERAATGAVWKRSLVGPYCPTVELGPDGKLAPAGGTP